MRRKQVDYNLPVGIKDDTLYLVNYTFEGGEMHGEPFQGVTGARLAPVSQAYIDARNEPENREEYYRDFWVEDVRAGMTELGLKEYVANIPDNEEGEFPGHDTSYIWDLDMDSELIKTHFPDAVTFECIGCGRVFKADFEFDVVFDEFLLSEIKRLEK